MKEFKKDQIKNICKVYSGATPSTTVSEFWNGDILWITPNDLSKVQTPFFSETERMITTEGLNNASTHLLPKGTLVMSSRAPIGYLAIAEKSFTTNQGCKSFVFNSNHVSLYFYYSLLNQIDKLKALGEGTTFAEVSKSFVEEFEILFPEDRNEQTQIAEILQATDEAITQTQKLVTKYQKIKMGLILDLLTKGIDDAGNIRSKAKHKFDIKNGIEVPVDWQVDTFEFFCEKVSVGIATSSSDYFSNDGVVFLRNQNIKEDEISLNDIIYITEEFANLNKSKYLREGDIITVRTGYPGMSAVVPKFLENSQTFTTLISRPKKEIANPHYMTYYLNSVLGKKQIKNLQGGGAQQNLNAGALSQLLIAMPKRHEQDRIVELIQAKDNVIKEEFKQLNKLKTLKTGLMQDLLTGKVRVYKNK